MHIIPLTEIEPIIAVVDLTGLGAQDLTVVALVFEQLGALDQG